MHFCNDYKSDIKNAEIKRRHEIISLKGTKADSILSRLRHPAFFAFLPFKADMLRNLSVQDDNKRLKRAVWCKRMVGANALGYLLRTNLVSL